MEIFALIIALGLYFLPTIIADDRKKSNIGLIAFINIAFGWSGLGWFIALVMACSGESNKVKKQDVNYLQQIVKADYLIKKVRNGYIFPNSIKDSEIIRHINRIANKDDWKGYCESDTIKKMAELYDVIKDDNSTDQNYSKKEFIEDKDEKGINIYQNNRIIENLDKENVFDDIENRFMERKQKR